MDICSGLQLNDISGNQLELIHGLVLRLKQLVEEVRESQRKSRKGILSNILCLFLFIDI